jgi:adenosine/AMP kinase
MTDSKENSHKIKVVAIENPYKAEVIIAQGNFTVYTIDDLYLKIKFAIPGIKFGIGMNESVPKLTRAMGNDSELKKQAASNSLSVGAGHALVIFLKNAFPIHVLNLIKSHPCICRVYAASSNPLQVVLAETSLGRSVLGVVDGYTANKIETVDEKSERRALVKKLGYSV